MLSIEKKGGQLCLYIGCAYSYRSIPCRSTNTHGNEKQLYISIIHGRLDPAIEWQEIVIENDERGERKGHLAGWKFPMNAQASPALIFDLDGTLIDGQEELQQVGAYHVYRDPADLLSHLDEGHPSNGLTHDVEGQ